MKALTNLEFIADAKAKIFSPCSNSLGEIYFACQNGKILKYKDGITVRKYDFRPKLRLAKSHQRLQWTRSARNAISPTWRTARST